MEYNSGSNRASNFKIGNSAKREADFKLRGIYSLNCTTRGKVKSAFEPSCQPRSQGLFPGLGAVREKTLASAGHVSILHPEILGVIN